MKINILPDRLQVKREVLLLLIEVVLIVVLIPISNSTSEVRDMTRTPETLGAHQQATFTPVREGNLLIYGRDNPITRDELPLLITYLDTEFSAGRTQVDPFTYYGTEILSPGSIAGIETAAGVCGNTYVDFLRINYAFYNQYFQDANLPYSLELRRLIVVDNGVSSPSGMSKEWMTKGPQDSHGCGGDSTYKAYVSWVPFWGNSIGEAWLPLHEMGHLCLTLPDSYWHDFSSIGDSALGGVSDNWKNYNVSRRREDGRSGIMNAGLPQLDLESQLILARRALNSTDSLPLTRMYYTDIEGFPNRFASENEIQVTNRHISRLAGSSVKVFRKKPDNTGLKLEEIYLGGITVNQGGRFTLPNLFADIAFDNGEHITTSYDTVFIRFEDTVGNLIAFMWMDSVDFSMATGIEQTYPNKIEYTIDPIATNEMVNLNQEDHNWSIGYRPLDGFSSGTYSNPTLQSLVNRYSTTKSR